MTPRSKEQDAERKRLARQKSRAQREAQIAAGLSDQEARDRDFARLWEAYEEYSARDVGMTVDGWRALPETEQNRLAENFEDAKFAADQGLTLTEYRVRKGRKFVAATEARL